MIDETTTRAVQRILAMRLAARGGRYTPAQKEFARSYAECAFQRVCRMVATTRGAADGLHIIKDNDHWFLMRASRKEFWEDNDEMQSTTQAKKKKPCRRNPSYYC